MGRADDGFTDVVRDHGGALLRTASLLTGNRARGEDLTQTALARAYAHWPDELRTALRQLSPRVRTAVVLRSLDDLSEAGTARLMGCSTKTVNNSVGRGLAVLRELLAAVPEPTSRRPA